MYSSHPAFSAVPLWRDIHPTALDLGVPSHPCEFSLVSALARVGHTGNV
jgi:hypothetical protein